MAAFVKSSIIDAPVESVFAFHERADALELLTPRFPPAHLIHRTGKGLEPGSTVALKVGFSKWIALHTEYERNRLFADTQIEGPFAKWVHRHEFESVDGRTRLTDRIEYELPGGPLVTGCLGWAVNIALNRMFNHRHRITVQYCHQP